MVGEFHVLSFPERLQHWMELEVSRVRATTKGGDYAMLCTQPSNTNEAPTCQGTKEVRRKSKGLPLLIGR
jgi:hypothetical protein